MKHIFFDLDHTLWDFEANTVLALKEIFKIESLPPHISEDQFYEVFSPLNQKLWTQLDLGQISHEHLRKNRFKLSFEALNLNISQAESEHLNTLFLETLPDQKLLISGCIPVLEALKSKYSLHILSNGYLEIQKRKMDSAGILPYFDQVITFDVSQYRKPDQGMFNYALDTVGAEINEVIMIGDNPIADVAGAKNAGWSVIHYDPNATETNTETCSELTQILEIIK